MTSQIRKDNETMKFGQLIEYNNRNIHLQKSGRKCDTKASSRLFLGF